MQNSNSKITPQCQKDNSDKSPFSIKHLIFFAPQEIMQNTQFVTSLNFEEL